MKIAVIGAGAIGGMLAVRLALSGQSVRVVDQGAHLEAIRRNGLKLVRADGAEEVAKDLRAVANCADAGPQDLVFLALKTYDVETVAPQMRALFAADTVVVPIQNGQPWWYFQNFVGPHAGYRLKTADPNGVIEQNIESRRIIGCVVYPAGEIIAPGVVKLLEGDQDLHTAGRGSGSPGRGGRVDRLGDRAGRANRNGDTRDARGLCAAQAAGDDDARRGRTRRDAKALAGRQANTSASRGSRATRARKSAASAASSCAPSSQRDRRVRARPSPR